jgi:hypothetical protein
MPGIIVRTDGWDDVALVLLGRDDVKAHLIARGSGPRAAPDRAPIETAPAGDVHPAGAVERSSGRLALMRSDYWDYRSVKWTGQLKWNCCAPSEGGWQS